MREKGERKRGKKERQGRSSEQETKERGDGGEKEKKIGRYYLQKVHLFPSLLTVYICQVSAGSMDVLCLILQGIYADAV